MKTITVKKVNLQILNKILDQLWANKQDLDGKFALNLARFAYMIKLELDNIENSRQSAIMRYGDIYKSEDGSIKIPTDSKEFLDFKSEYEAILNSDFKIDVIPFKHDDIKNVKDLSPEIYLNLVEICLLEV